MNFDTAFERLIGHEGGYTDDPKDPGNWTTGKVGMGELKGTKFGIAANSYAALDIKNLTLNDAKAIYRRDYWSRLRLDELPAPIRFALFDVGVNSGTGQAAKFLQRALGVADDGVIGPKTIAMAGTVDPYRLAAKIHGLRLAFMADLSTWPAFSRGWARRIAANLIEI